MVAQNPRLSAGVIRLGAFLWRLLLLLTICFALIKSSWAISKRSEAFVGYTERDAQSSLCSDKMDFEICASYKKSGMCKTGAKSPQDTVTPPCSILSLSILM